MKKILFAAVAVVAMTFAACDGKKQTAEDIDATAVAQMTDNEQINGAANQVVDALKAQIANSDKAQVEAIVAKAVEAAQGLLNNGNYEGAAKYVQTVTTFIAENQETLAALGIDTSALIPTAVTDALSSATTLSTGVQTQVDDVATTAQEQVEGAVDNAKQAAEDAANQTVQHASQAAQQAVDDAASQANDAVNKAAQQVMRNIPGSK